MKGCLSTATATATVTATAMATATTTATTTATNLDVKSGSILKKVLVKKIGRSWSSLGRALRRNILKKVLLEGEVEGKAKVPGKRKVIKLMYIRA